MDILHIYDISIYINMYIDFINSILLENPTWLIQIPNSKGTKSMCTSMSKHIIMHMGAHTYATQLDMALGPQASHVESSSLSNLRKALCLWLVWLSLIFSFHLSPASFRVYFHSSFFFPFNLAQCEEVASGKQFPTLLSTHLSSSSPSSSLTLPSTCLHGLQGHSIALFAIASLHGCELLLVACVTCGSAFLFSLRSHAGHSSTPWEYLNKWPHF